MKIHFYIKPDRSNATVNKVLEVFRSREAREFNSHRYSGEWVDGINFREDEYGLFTETDMFLHGVPDGVRSLPVRVVTLYDEVSHEVRGGEFPQLGIYKLGRATAIVDTYVARRSTGRDSMDSGTLWEDYLTWRIRIKGKTLAAVEALYRQFRMGLLEPTETWTDAPSQITGDEEGSFEPTDA